MCGASAGGSSANGSAHATANTGSGTGGTRDHEGNRLTGNGGSGVVIFRYQFQG